MDKIKIIGVDYSLNSPAFCILSDEGNMWGSLHRTDKDVHKMIAKPKSPFNVLGSDPHFKFSFLSRRKPEGEYYECERMKLETFEEISEGFFSLFEDQIDENTYVFMEGISFGSPGNSLIDISMSTAMVRLKIKNAVGHDRMFIFSPSSIKKFAVKGNAKKDELYNALIEKHIENEGLKPLVANLKQNIGDWVKGSKNVETPCSDIVDATWIALFGKNLIEETFLKQPV